MPDFELTGPDGATYQVSAPDEGSALSAFRKMTGAPAPAPAPVTTNDVVRSAASGVPLVGGLLNKANAATNALVAPTVEPFMAKGPESINDAPGATVLERYINRFKKSLAIQDAHDAQFSAEHPYVDTAAKIVGGVGAFGGAIKAVPALAGPLGFEGTLPAMVGKGAASGAAISAADAALRGEDIGDHAQFGAITGAAGGPAGRVIGKVAGKVAEAFRPTPALKPALTVPVAGVDVPVPNTEPKAAATIEIARRGGAGAPAQDVVAAGDAARDAALERAKAGVGGMIDPAASGGRPPQDAAAAVAEELRAAEQTRFQTEQAARQRTEAGLEELRSGVMPPQPPGAPVPVPVASPGAAAEVVGSGVQGRAAAARAGYQADYKAASEMPSEFAPGTFRPVGEAVRARLSSGEQPVVADTETTPNTVKMLRDLDTNVGLGNFQNEAAPAGGAVGGVPNVSRETGTDAELAYRKLTGMGVAPDKARTQVASLPGAEALPGSPLAPHEVSLPGGGAVSVVPKVVEASSVRTSADAGYDPALQPRNRARAASDAQVNDIAANLNPNRLGLSAEADRGAPIIGPDAMVESGNGRILAIRKAYEAGGPAAERYRGWLAGQGVDVSKFKQPVLVRERATPMSPSERQAFTVAANQSSNLSMSATERALTDARVLTPDSLALIKNPGDLGAVENRAFVREFVSKLPQAEQGAMVTASGDLSSEGLTRVRNAVIGKAYGNSPTLTRIAESTSDEVRSISNALTAAAPEWAALREAAKAGQIPANLDITPDLLDAVNRTARLRAKGTSLADGQAQTDAFTKQTPESAALQRLFYAADGEKAAPASQVASALRNYAQEAAKVDAAPGLNLGLAPVTAKDILETTAAKVGAPAELAKSVSAAAETAVTEAAAAGKTVDLNAVDAARKRLVSFYQDAKGHSASDARAARAVLKEFDQFVIDAVDSPAYRGDPAALDTLRRARAGVAEYHKQFSGAGRGDEVGPMVEKILGRFPGQQATPDQIAQMSYGSRAEPGGAQAVKVSQRIRQILGPTSPEWGAYKQGLVAHVVDDAAGARPMTATDKANRIDAFLNGTKGRPLAQAVLSADERAALARHADTLRASEPTPLKDLGSIDKKIARITGRDGFPPSSLQDVTATLFGPSAGKAADNFNLVVRLKRDLSPDGFQALQSGMWSHLTDVPPGKLDVTAQRIWSNLDQFLNGSGAGLSKVIFPAPIRAEMQRLADAFKMHVPVGGTTNPSGTAPMIAKIGAKLAHGILPTVGLVHGGIPGAIVGAVADKGVTSLKNSRAAKEAGLLYYGAQPKVPSSVPDLAKSIGLLTRGAAQGQVGTAR